MGNVGNAHPGSIQTFATDAFAGYTGSFCSIPIESTPTTASATTNPTAPSSSSSSASSGTQNTANATCNPACAHGTCYQSPSSGMLSCICDGTGREATTCLGQQMSLPEHKGLTVPNVLIFCCILNWTKKNDVNECRIHWILLQHPC